MPPLPSVSGARIVRALERHGFKIARVSGSHHIMRHRWVVACGGLGGVQMRPAELAAIRAGDVDVAFRRWERPRLKVGTRIRTAVGLVEVTSVDRVAVGSLTAADARRAGAVSSC